jgi:hypothetical protein
MKMHRIIWYSAFPWTPRQLALLQTQFGADVKLVHGGLIKNAQALAGAFRKSGADDLVVIAPMAMLEALLREGIRPIWPESEPCGESHPERDIKTRDGRCFRSTGFSRLVELRLEQEEPKALKVSRPPAKVLWAVREHRPETSAMVNLTDLYGADVQVDIHPQGFTQGGHRAIAEEFRQGRYNDLVVVAPLPVFEGLTALGILPLKVTLEGRTQRLSRVTGLTKRFEPL